MKTLFTAIFGIALMASCKKDETIIQTVETTHGSSGIYSTSYKAALTGDQEVPTHSSNAFGSFDATYYSSDKTLNYKLTFTSVPGTVFKPTVAHIHKGVRGVDGNSTIVFDLGPLDAAAINRRITLTDAQAEELSRGMYYVHIHSQAFPEGDIRGQIEK